MVDPLKAATDTLVHWSGEMMSPPVLARRVVEAYLKAAAEEDGGCRCQFPSESCPCCGAEWLLTLLEGTDG